MKKILILLILMSVAVIVGGAVQEKQAESRAGGAMPMMTMMQNCLMNLADIDVAVLDIPSGSVLRLTTKPENVADLRRRVEQMAAMHMGNSSNEATMKGPMMAGTFKYEPIENGAQLTLTPKDPARLDQFQAQVRAHVERMKKGECSMMSDMMQGMMKGMMGAGH
jgi:hypothetical protein